MAEVSLSSPIASPTVNETLSQRVKEGRARGLKEKLLTMVRENPARTGLDALTEKMSSGCSSMPVLMN
ncbi:MAG: hypothetical protein Q8N98_02520 [bacterium]|nr:hypothetical protein [bacterium]